MNLKDKIILVYYVGISNLSNEYDVNDYLTQLRDSVAHDNDDSVEEFFVPVSESNEIRIECTNPVMISEEKYAEVEKKLSELKEKMEKAIENYSKKQ